MHQTRCRSSGAEPWTLATAKPSWGSRTCLVRSARAPATCIGDPRWSAAMGCGSGGPLPVGIKSSLGDSPLGLCDMAGKPVSVGFSAPPHPGCAMIVFRIVISRRRSAALCSRSVRSDTPDSAAPPGNPAAWVGRRPNAQGGAATRLSSRRVAGVVGEFGERYRALLVVILAPQLRPAPFERRHVHEVLRSPRCAAPSARLRRT